MVAIRYLQDMEIRDILIANLRYAIARFGSPKALADRTEQGSAKYFEQMVSGFQGKKDRNPRKPGAKVASAVERALGEEAGWMYRPHPNLWAEYGVDAAATEAPRQRDEHHGSAGNAAVLLPSTDAATAQSMAGSSRPVGLGTDLNFEAIDAALSGVLALYDLTLDEYLAKRASERRRGRRPVEISVPVDLDAPAEQKKSRQ